MQYDPLDAITGTSHQDIEKWKTDFYDQLVNP